MSRAPMGLTVRSSTDRRLFAFRRRWFDKLEVAHGEFVEPHIAVFFDAFHRCDVAYRCVLSDVR